MTAGHWQGMFLKIRHPVHLLFIPKLVDTFRSKALIRRDDHPCMDSQLSPASMTIQRGQAQMPRVSRLANALHSTSAPSQKRN